MASVSKLTVPDPDLDSWHLTDVTAALLALGEIIAKGYRGGPIFDATSQVIGIEINGDNTHSEARLGDWLVEHIGIRAYTDSVYSANFTTEV